MTRTATELARVAQDLKVVRSWHKPPYTACRTRAGHWQLAGGAWKIMLVDSEGHVVFGSQWSGQAVVTAHKNGLTHAYCAAREPNRYSDVDIDCDYNKCKPGTPRELQL